MPHLIVRLLQRELGIAWQSRSATLMPLAFFLLIVVLFPLALNPQPQLLQAMAPAVLWVTALLASTLALEKLFKPDYEAGSLQQWLMLPMPTGLLMAIRLVAHWMIYQLPLLVIVPVFALLYGLTLQHTELLALGLLLGSITLVFSGSLIAALTLAVQRSGVLLVLLLLPLFVPVVIFAGGMLEPLNQNSSEIFLLAYAVVSITIVPWLTGKILYQFL